MRLWDRIFDTYVHHPMQNIVGDRMGGSQGDMAPQRATIAKAYAMLDQHLQGRTWISQRGYSMADCAASPALFYASVMVPITNEHANLQAYFERLVQRPSYARVLQEAKPYFQYFPFVADLPQRFLP